jgi:glutamate formiminotransferase
VPLIECIPNISEGRRADVVSACAAAVRRHASLLDVTSDVAHNRSVLTFVGEPDEVIAAAEAVFEPAVAQIDLRRHEGEHPRIGAVDVVPFVPMCDTTMAVCVEVAQSLAGRVARRFGIPVYLYEHASPGRRPLEEIRRGGLPGLVSRMSHAGWKPDYGPGLPHPTAGVSVVGARAPLVAYNVELGTDALAIAQRIARSVRESSGGLPALKAIGIYLNDRAIAQVSMNLTDFRVTSIRQAFDAVTQAAQREGVSVLASELIGLAPAAALTAEIAADVKLRGFDPDRMILERRIEAAGR